MSFSGIVVATFQNTASHPRDGEIGGWELEVEKDDSVAAFLYFADPGDVCGSAECGFESKGGAVFDKLVHLSEEELSGFEAGLFRAEWRYPCGDEVCIDEKL